MSDMTTVSVSSSSVTATATNEKGPANNNKKRNLTLDLNKPSSHLTVPATSGNIITTSTGAQPADLRTSPGFVLTSPDVQMLQLASPDLEKFIIQGLMGQSTPTPTQIVFPKNVTEEQGL